MSCPGGAAFPHDCPRFGSDRTQRGNGRPVSMACKGWTRAIICCNAQDAIERYLDGQTVSETRLKLMEAIARKRVLAARYNGDVIKLAPHLLFERRGDLFTSALNLSKAWRSDDERRLGQFKLMGLAAIELLDENFDPLPSFQPEAPRSDDTVILAI